MKGSPSYGYHLPLLSADAIKVRETAKLSRVIEWVETQFLIRKKQSAKVTIHIISIAILAIGLLVIYSL